MKMTKKRQKCSKCTESTIFLSIDPPPLKQYLLYTQFNVDNYGQPLSSNAVKSPGE